MKLHFSGKDLFGGFNLVAGIVPTSALKGVLKGVKVEVKNERVEFVATDLEVLVKYVLPAGKCEGEGGIVLPAVRVNNVLREWAGNDEISVSIEEGNCTLKSGGGHFKIAGEDFRQFPEIGRIKTKGLVEVDGGIIADMVGRVVHSVSTVKVRSMLCGIFVRVMDDYIIMVAADGNRMSSVKRKVNNPEGISFDGIVAVKCLTFLQRFVSECKGILTLGMGEQQVCFAGEKGEIISQLIEGQYPKYEELIPKGNDKRVEVDRNQLLSGVRMASFMTNEEYRIVKFIFRQGKLLLSSRTADVGEAELEIAVGYDGPDLEISFDPEYVIDALKVSDNDTVVIELSDCDSAALIRTGYEQLDVIMPIETK
ncbi:MAG: DNA polymerase III subunit beta [Candidatus Brocadia sp.]|jgi:DNA polymerase III, beta subunit|uniref:Beta sliding clamp n=1 Tax=Candidatus Brocadia fulgida TaxID=380242 RepID=A0A0M2UUW6_9BACT|nr:MAG: DNA polymerase III beta subunit [Candidatus Brocadia fulgida]MCC6324120.1 DNA polymerase III subunit beta [Candidatus Brocadia sp.]MCE7911720.1 DNA polymerase III subunit beta [Candidatus Brocadia sp. AMX3]MBV6519063.1 Beta sliding clamp [Candidatus Brocadia fulgida]MDG5995701.1 DNA polymerase III subunit beta [Candidatus Brocadia sp.]